MTSALPTGFEATSRRGGAMLAAAAGLWRAARWGKNLPLLLLPCGGALLAGAPPDLQILAASAVAVLLGAGFMTHLNGLTDRELDRARKPELARWLTAVPGLTVLVMAVEAGATLTAIGWLLGSGHAEAGGALAAFLFLTVQYSYNLLDPRDPVASRWKCTVLGHAVVVLGGYAALWIAGLGCAAAAAPVARWLPLVLAVSLSEYALFLGESAIDAREERAACLGTLSARLGARRTNLVALGLALVAVAAIAAAAAGGAPRAVAVALAFLPPALWRLAVLVVLSQRRSEARDRALRRRLPDPCFSGARAFTVVALFVLL